MRSVFTMLAVAGSILFAGTEASAQWQGTGGRGSVTVFTLGFGSGGYAGFGNFYSGGRGYYPAYPSTGYQSVYTNDAFGFTQSGYQSPIYNQAYGQSYYQTPVYYQSYYQTPVYHQSYGQSNYLQPYYQTFPSYYPMSRNTVIPATYYRRGR